MVAVVTACVWLVGSSDAAGPQGDERLPSLADTRWKLVTFDDKRPTEYTCERAEERVVVQAVSDSAASWLVAEIPREMRPPAVSWRWHVEQCLDNDRERERSGDDFAARVFVFYGRESAWTPWGWFRRRLSESPFGDVVPKRAVSYVWASRGPQDDVFRHPTFGNVSTVVVRSECHDVGTWVSEHRELQADFTQAFDESMPEVVGVALMTDPDDTRSRVLAWYSDITLHLASGQALTLPLQELVSD